MFEINNPIMFGNGTTLVTSYYYPTFKTGLMIAIADSKKKFEKTGQISDKEFREAYNGILKELYFDKPETLDKFINQLQTCLDEWKGEQNDI